MSDGAVQLSVYQVAAAYLFILVVLWIVKNRGIQREKTILLASVRMTLQLILTGYVLVYIFDRPSPWFTLAIIAVMETFSVYTVYKKFKGRLSKRLKRVIAFSLPAGTLVCLIYFLFVVIRIDPWYNPQYFIPLGGMLVGNSMTGISLGVKSLIEGMQTSREYVEEALVLGATPRMATRDIINRTFDAAIMPTLNSMLGMGIVFLPGMMTGQILSGTVPTTAIAYQMAIMLGILGAVSISVITMLLLGYRTFFNSDDQLMD
ncbi:MAG: UDP-glucose/iron transport system permease protein [Clostridiales bacterium]|jgi:putative ABC transport system permease protein|nr:UDP-glucose/iron transport system permease protein [Clostridiales bacterium]